MGERTTFRTGAGPATADVARPDGGRGPGLLIVPDDPALEGSAERLCDRFAAHGYVAVAAERGDGTSGEAARDLTAAVDLLLGLDEVTGHRVGVIGVGERGLDALVVASAVPDRVAAVAVLHGVPHGPGLSPLRLRCPVLLHVGDAAPEAVERTEQLAVDLRDAGARVGVEVHPGAGAGFVDDTRPERFDAYAAGRAEQLTVAFLDDHLG